MEEKRLSQRDAVDGVVQIVAPVQLHLQKMEGGVSNNTNHLEMTKNAFGFNS